MNVNNNEIDPIKSFLISSEGIENSRKYLVKAKGKNWEILSSKFEQTPKLDVIFKQLEKDLESCTRWNPSCESIFDHLEAVERRVDQLKTRFDKVAGIWGRIFHYHRYQSVSQSYQHLKDYLNGLKKTAEWSKTHEGYSVQPFLSVEEEDLKENQASHVAVYKACRDGDANELQKLLDQHKSVFFKDKEERSLLHIASANGHTQICEILLKKGWNINETDKNGQTPLHFAARHQRTQVVSFLISRQAEVNQKDKEGKTAFAYAYKAGFASITQLLLPLIKSTHMDELLIIAASQGDVNFMQDLLNGEANAVKLIKHTKNELGQNLIHIATQHGQSKVIDLLADRLKSKPHRLYEMINHKDRQRMTALHIACKNNNLKLAKILIQHRAKLEVRDAQGHTPLLLAGQYGDWNLVHYLANKGANLKAVNTFGLNILHQVCWNKREDWVEELIGGMAHLSQQGLATFYKRDNRRCYPLHLATSSGHVRTVQSLLPYLSEQDVNRKERNGKTALHLAAEAGLGELISLLIDSKVDVHAKTYSEKTALHFACEKNHLDSVKTLIKHGADIDGRENEEGDTPLLLASRYGNWNLVDFLVSKGADYLKTNYSGNNWLHQACLNEQSDDVINGLIGGIFSKQQEFICRYKPNKRGDFPLHTACRLGRVNVVKALTSTRYLTAEQLNKESGNEVTALEEATRLGQLEIAQILVKYEGIHVSQECVSWATGKRLLHQGRDNNMSQAWAEVEQLCRQARKGA